MEEELAIAEENYREPAITLLYFRGKPVVGTSGIVAKFGLEAVNQYSQLVVALAAQMSGHTLGDRGMIPNCKDNQLLITGTALGSFGFQLEENIENDECLAEDGSSIIGNSMKKAVSIFKASTEPDDTFSEEIYKLENRVIREIHHFLEILSNNEAFCSIETRNDYFIFEGHEQVKRSSRRFAKSNIREETDTLIGEFTGVLPKSRDFEFKLSQDNEIIKGKISPLIKNAANINNLIAKRLGIKVEKRTAGTSKPRFTLLHIDDKAVY